MVKRTLFNIASRLALQPYYRQVRGLTLGTRTAVIDGDGHVLLVRHSYAPGWMLPGGGVERGETIYQSARRELREEAAIEALEEPRLHGFYLNEASFPGDHVACLVLRRFSQGARRGSLEIAEAKFFPATALPESATGGTRRRIAEIFDGVPVAAAW
jgi:ADP-ribose pyrophosphatase YjhB (NUDIX family)